MKFLFAVSMSALALVPLSGAGAQSVPRAPTPTPAPSSAQHSADWQNRRANAGFQNEYNTKVLLGADLTPAKRHAVAKDVVECLIRSAPDLAPGMVGGPMTEDAQYSALAAALSGRYDSCVDQNAAAISMALVNGALAEELIHREDRQFEPRAMAVNVTAADKFYGGVQSPTIVSLARCLAIYSPGLAKAVLLASPGSAEEKGALASLYGKSPECEVSAPPSHIPIEEQRSALATGLYLWTRGG